MAFKWAYYTQSRGSPLVLCNTEAATTCYHGTMIGWWSCNFFSPWPFPPHVICVPKCVLVGSDYAQRRKGPNENLSLAGCGSIVSCLRVYTRGGCIMFFWHPPTRGCEKWAPKHTQTRFSLQKKKKYKQNSLAVKITDSLDLCHASQNGSQLKQKLECFYCPFRCCHLSEIAWCTYIVRPRKWTALIFHFPLEEEKTWWSHFPAPPAELSPSAPNSFRTFSPIP